MIDVTNSGQFCPSIPKSVAKKLLIATNLIKPIDKSETNKTQNYKFQPWNIIQAEVRKALVEAELLCLTSVRDHTQVDGETKAGGAQYRHVAWVDVQFVDPDTGECWATTWAGEAFESGDKGLQKAITSAVKYALLKTFHISDKDTKEADAETSEEPAKRPAPSDAQEKAAWAWLKGAGFGRDDKAWIEGRGLGVIDLVGEAREQGCKTKAEVVAYFNDGVVPGDDKVVA